MRSRSFPARAAAIAAVVALALALPAGAIAASPLGGVTTPATTTATTPATTTLTPATVPTTTSTSGGGLSPAVEIGIGLAAAGVLGAIAYVIRSDSRLNAGRHAVVDIDREKGTLRPQAERVKQNRARAKAARRARRARRAGR